MATQQAGTRFPTGMATLSATGLFALLQAGFILVRQQSFDVSSAVGLAKLGVVAAFVTVFALALLVLAARRLHPAWKEGDPRRATRSLLFGAVAGLTAWMIVDAWVAGPLIPEGLEVWIEIAAALAVALVVARRPPSARFCGRSAFLAVPAILLVFVPAPGGGPSGANAGAVEAALDAGSVDLAAAPDVVLVSVDTFRADRVGAYGSSDSLTPEIDRFAAEGFVFERAVAAAPWTVPSVTSMLTGLPTIRHGAGLPASSGPAFVRSPMRGDVVTLAERYAAAGYRTHAVVANGFLSPAIGVARGFDVFEAPFWNAMGSIFVRDIPLARFALALYPVERWADFRARGLTDRALELLGEPRAEPLFLWLHYIDLHTPFQADPGDLDLDAWTAEIHQTQPKVREDGTVVGDVFAGTSNVRGGMLWLGPTDRERIEEYYDRAVAYVDGELGRLFASLRAREGERPVVAVLTSDHGEEFWDHGHFEHGHDYYREVTRIPMVFWGPGRVPAGREGVEPVGLVDVGSTLLDLAGLPVPAAESPDEGRTLVGYWEREPSATAAAESPPPAGEPGAIRFSEGNLYGIPSVLLEEGDWRFILRAHGAGELYHAFDDPGELVNRASEHPELVARYRQLLEPRLALLREESAGGVPVLDAETKRALQSLGYVQ